MKLDLEYIEELRKEAGLTQEEVNRFLDYSTKQYTHIVNSGKADRYISYERVLKLAMLYDVTPYDLTIEEPGDYEFLELIE